MMNKLKSVLTSSEKKQIIILALGSLVLALSETISIGIIIPIMSLFIDQEKIHTSHMLSSLYQLLRVKDISFFLPVLIIIAILVFILRAAFSIFMAYAQQRVIGRIYIRLTSNVLETYLEKPYSFYLTSNSSELFKNLNFEVGQFTTGFLTPIILISSEIWI